MEYRIIQWWNNRVTCTDWQCALCFAEPACAIDIQQGSSVTGICSFSEAEKHPASLAGDPDNCHNRMKKYNEPYHIHSNMKALRHTWWKQKRVAQAY